MAHISFSEFKNWSQCPHYHKLVNIDKIKMFKGNEYTAFGTAIHDVCEVNLGSDQGSTAAENMFVHKFLHHLGSLKEQSVKFDAKLLEDLHQQGKKLAPLIMPEVNNRFEEYEVIATELPIFEPIDDLVGFPNYNFKGYIDAVIKTPDGKHHLIDWKTCSWGWDMKRKTDKIVSYQLTFYKYFYCKKYNIDPSDVVTYFVLLKRTAKKDNVEFFKVSSGSKKTQNALNLLKKSVHNIMNGIHIKNRLSCSRCEFRNTEFCT